MSNNIYCKCCNQNIWKEIKNTIGGDYLRCANCHYHMHRSQMNELLDHEFQAAQEKFYGSNSIMFSPLFESLEDESTARRIQILRKHLKKGRIIEIGPGTGRFLAAAIDSGFDVDAVEHSKTFTDEINRRFGLKIRTGKFEDQEFNNQKYKAYLSFHVIEHVPDVILHLQKATSIIERDGYAMIATPNAKSWEHRLSSVLSPNYCSSHIHLFTEKSLSLCLDQTGWKVIKVFTPAYTSSWPRVATSLFRSKKKQDSASGGEYIQSPNRGIFFLVKTFRLLSKPFRLVQEFFKGGNELFIIAVPKTK